MGFCVLSAQITDDYRVWLNEWKRWPGREVFAHPDYVRLFCRNVDQAICAVWKSNEGGVFFPLILRPLKDEVWANTASGHSDIIGPYGYGGPYCWGEINPLIYWDEFDEWAKRAKIVSCFTRLSLFTEQLLPFRGTVEMRAPNIVRTLNVPLDVMWMQYEHKVRKNVKRAQEEGISVERDETGSRLDEFLSVYYSTMERRGASERYFFPREFFIAIINALSNQFVFFNAIRHGRMISSELVLVSARHLYSFLGGTLAESFSYRPNDLIKHSIIQWGLEMGKSTFILGGGYGGPDGIYRFKRSFAPDGECEFYVGKRIWDEHVYADMIDMRRTFERQAGRSWEPKKGFFPAYRG
jgi:hypothetical protein